MNEETFRQIQFWKGAIISQNSEFEKNGVVQIFVSFLSKIISSLTEVETEFSSLLFLISEFLNVFLHILLLYPFGTGWTYTVYNIAELSGGRSWLSFSVNKTFENLLTGGIFSTMDIVFARKKRSDVSVIVSCLTESEVGLHLLTIVVF